MEFAYLNCELCEICNALSRVQGKTLWLIGYTLHEYIQNKTSLAASRKMDQSELAFWPCMLISSHETLST